MGTNGSLKTEEFIQNLQLFTHLAQHNIEERFVSQVADGAVSFIQMNLLRVLGLHPGQTVGDVARFMGVSYPAATKTIDKLVRLGYLKRKEDSRDRRIAHLHLTPAGQKIVDKYSGFKEARIKQVLDRFEEEIIREINERFLDLSRAIIDEMNVSPAACMHCGAFDPEYCRAAGFENDCGYLVKQGKSKAVKS